MSHVMAAVDPAPELESWKQLRDALDDGRPADPKNAIRALLEPHPLLLDYGP
jgi:hypothetical protein